MEILTERASQHYKTSLEKFRKLDDELQKDPRLACLRSNKGAGQWTAKLAPRNDWPAWFNTTSSLLWVGDGIGQKWKNHARRTTPTRIDATIRHCIKLHADNWPTRETRVRTILDNEERMWYRRLDRVSSVACGASTLCNQAFAPGLGLSYLSKPKEVTMTAVRASVPAYPSKRLCSRVVFFYSSYYYI